MSEKYYYKNGRFYWYVRRVPLHLIDVVGQDIIRISLKTDDELLARNKSSYITEQMDKLWSEAIVTEKTVDNKRYARLVSLAKVKGFTYKPAEEIVKEPIEAILDRIKVAKSSNRITANAVLGTDAVPYPKISQCLETYWNLTRDEQAGKSADELRKWKNPRIKAMKNLADCLNDKEINLLTRADAVFFRLWWMDRIEEDNLMSGTANRDFTHCRTILSTVTDAYHNHLDVRSIFSNIKVKGGDGKRSAFTTEYIQNILLNRKTIKTNDELFYFLCVMAGTGARVKEIVGLLPEEIKLDHNIPHIQIRKNKIRGLKNQVSERDIPLTGIALEAMRKIPEGFTHYREKGDNLSNALNKYMRENKLYPSEEHSLYSLRHSFQDRLTAVECPERVQADLMGHAIARPRYGEGSSLEQKFEWLERIKLQARQE